MTREDDGLVSRYVEGIATSEERQAVESDPDRLLEVDALLDADAALRGAPAHAASELPATLDELRPTELPAALDELLPTELPATLDELLPTELPATLDELLPDELPATLDELLPAELPGTLDELRPAELPATLDELLSNAPRQAVEARAPVVFLRPAVLAPALALAAGIAALIVFAGGPADRHDRDDRDDGDDAASYAALLLESGADGSDRLSGHVDAVAADPARAQLVPNVRKIQSKDGDDALVRETMGLVAGLHSRRELIRTAAAILALSSDEAGCAAGSPLCDTASNIELVHFLVKLSTLKDMSAVEARSEDPGFWRVRRPDRMIVLAAYWVERCASSDSRLGGTCAEGST